MQPHSPNQVNQTSTPQEPDVHQLSPETKVLIRKTIRLNQIIVGIPLLFFLLTFLFSYIDAALFFLLFVATFFSSVFIGVKIYAGSDKFKLKYRQTVINGILRNAFNELTYEPDSYLTVKEFYASGLLEKFPNVYHPGNYIKLSRPNYNLEICYAYAASVTIC